MFTGDSSGGTGLRHVLSVTARSAEGDSAISGRRCRRIRRACIRHKCACPV
jgi:hypothetical protein